jgi:hypothetical protein
MASEILLIPVDTPTSVEPSASSEEASAPLVEPNIPSVMPPDELAPSKRGRGRPPGAKNKAKPVVKEPPTPRNTNPTPPPPSEEEVSEDGSEDTPPPPPTKKKPKKRQAQEEVEPSSPRSQRRQIHVDAQTRRHDHHTDRVRGYSTLLDTMLAY